MDNWPNMLCHNAPRHPALLMRPHLGVDLRNWRVGRSFSKVYDIAWCCMKHNCQEPARIRRKTIIATAAAATILSFAERLVEGQDRSKECLVKDRPRYIGCTDSAEVRESVCRLLLRSLPVDQVDEFWSVVGSMSGLDVLNALAMAKIPVKRCIFFDRDPDQLLFGELMVVLLDMCPTRDRFVQTLFGRSMTAWGRSMSVSTMLDFLDQPWESGIEADIVEQLPNHLRAMYATVFKCLAHRAGWPAVWPSFGW